VGVSPPTSHKKTGAFVKRQLSLFLVLTIAVSIPLWFYSEKILFNAHYRAAKSETLQQWLEESELDLIDVDIFREKGTLSMSLEGPSPPVNVGELHRRLLAELPDMDPDSFHIEYTWTQKVSGIWPQKGGSLGEIAKVAKASVAKLTARKWIWQKTQYDADTGARPDKKQRYTLSFSTKGKFAVQAECGSWKGKYSFGGRSLDIKMGKNFTSGCRKDKVMKVILEDLGRARAAYIKSGKLQMTLAGSEGIMYFEGR
jgi:hypothetical protein